MLSLERNNTTKLQDLEVTFKGRAIVDKLKDILNYYGQQKYCSKGITPPMKNI
jgi:hypothetical protein